MYGSVGGTTGTSSSLIAIPTPMQTNSLGAKCFDLKREILGHASNLGKKQSKVTEQFWICLDMLEVPKRSQVFLPGHGWSRLVTGGHGSVPLHLVLGVSPRSRVVTGGHGWSRVGSFIFSIGCFSPVTGGHGWSRVGPCIFSIGCLSPVTVGHGWSRPLS